MNFRMSSLWSHFLRPYMVFKKQIQKFGNQIIKKIEEDTANSRPEWAPKGVWQAVHIRRGDFKRARRTLELHQIIKVLALDVYRSWDKS